MGVRLNSEKIFLLPFSRTPTSEIEMFSVEQEVGGRLCSLPFSRTPTSEFEMFSVE